MKSHADKSSASRSPVLRSKASRIVSRAHPHRTMQRALGNQAIQAQSRDTINQIRRSYFSGDHQTATQLCRQQLSTGHALPKDVQQKMQHRLGYDFSAVRIHTGYKAAELNHALEANAFTVGNHIAFAPGKYKPESKEGQNRLAHELIHTVQQKGSGTGRTADLENQATAAAGLGARYKKPINRVRQTILREPTYPRRATADQMTDEAQRVLSLSRDIEASDDTQRMWSNVSTNFLAVSTGSLARKIWTHIFLRHFTEQESRGDVESAHPRYLYSHQYGWIDAQHFFGFIDFAEQQYLRTESGDRQAAFDAATEQGTTIEERQQMIREYIVLQQEPPRDDVLRLMQVRPPNTALFRVPVMVGGAITHAAADLAGETLLSGTQGELYRQLNERQRYKFFMDSAKSAFTFEDFVSNQLGTRFFFQYGIDINSVPVADRAQLFMARLREFFQAIQIENDQARLDELAQHLPTIERFEAPKTTEALERSQHPELFRLP